MTAEKGRMSVTEDGVELPEFRLYTSIGSRAEKSPSPRSSRNSVPAFFLASPKGQQEIVTPSNKVIQDRLELENKVGPIFFQRPLLPRTSTRLPEFGDKDDTPRDPHAPADSYEEKLPNTGQLDNVLAGFGAGLQLVMGAMVCASLTFTSGNITQMQQALPLGIAMNLFGLMVLIVVTCTFSAVPYGLPAVQDTPAIMIGALAKDFHAASGTKDIVPTVIFSMIMISVGTGILYILIGYFHLSEFMQQLPHSVISGFLGAIGIWVTVSAFALMSGVEFVYIFPSDWEAFLRPHSVAQMSLGIGLFFIVQGTPLVALKCCSQVTANRLAQMMMFPPLALFWIFVYFNSITLKILEEEGWIFTTHCTYYTCAQMWNVLYYWIDVDWALIWHLRFEFVTIWAIMCMNAILGFSGIEASRSKEKTVLDHNREIMCLGLGNIASGLLAGQSGYHQIPISVYAHNAGLHNRFGAYTAASVALVVFFSGLPLPIVLPKWYLGGIFLNMGFLFLKQWLFDALWTMPFWEYVQIWIVATVAIWTSFPNAVVVGIIIAMYFFVREATLKDPIKSVRRLDHLPHKASACLPETDRKILEDIGHEAVWISFNGDLFFGNAKILYDSILSIFATYAIWDFRDVRHIDIAAVEILRNASSILKSRRTNIIVTQISPTCRMLLSLEGLLDPPSSEAVQREILLGSQCSESNGWHSSKSIVQHLNCDGKSCHQMKGSPEDKLEYRETIEESLAYVDRCLLEVNRRVWQEMYSARPDTPDKQKSGGKRKSQTHSELEVIEEQPFLTTKRLLFPKKEHGQGGGFSPLRRPGEAAETEPLLVEDELEVKVPNLAKSMKILKETASLSPRALTPVEQMRGRSARISVLLREAKGVDPSLGIPRRTSGGLQIPHRTSRPSYQGSLDMSGHAVKASSSKMSLPSYHDTALSSAWELIKQVGSEKNFSLGAMVYDLGDEVDDSFYAVEEGMVDILISMFGYWERCERVQECEVLGEQGYILGSIQRQHRAIIASETAVLWLVTRSALDKARASKADSYQHLQDFLLRMMAASVRLHTFR